MKKGQFTVLVLVTAVAGFLGGAASERLFSASPSLAAAKAAPPKSVAAQEYRLLDAKGKVQVKIGFNTDGLATLFWNYRGKDPNLQGKEQALVLGTISLPQAPAPKKQ